MTQLLKLTVLCGLLAAGATAVVYLRQGSQGEKTNDPAPTPGAASRGVTDKPPGMLLTSRRGELLIVAIDFFESRALDPGVPVGQRRQYVLEQSLRLYAEEYAEPPESVKAVRLHALSVPERDEYAKGSFKNLTELAVLTTDPQRIGDGSRTAADRFSTVVWKGPLAGE